MVNVKICQFFYVYHTSPPSNLSSSRFATGMLVAILKRNPLRLINRGTKSKELGRVNHEHLSNAGLADAGRCEMTPVALLVCMAIVTNVNHGSVVTNDCHYEQPAVAMVSESPVITAAVETTRRLDAQVKALAVVDVPAEVKPVYKKRSVHNVRVHHRVKAVNNRSVMTAAQDKAFRHSWYKRLVDM
jgi:hypothetical protein